LIGGETAEMPGMYVDGEYDLAGFAVGVVEKGRIIDGREIVAGDAVIGVASSGPHSNGFSLIRKIIDSSGTRYDEALGETTLGDALLTPTRIYVKPLLALMKALTVKGMAHVTGGGLVENLPRMLPDAVAAHLDRESWRRPPVFDWLQRRGNVTDAEMHRVFNCGIGMAIVVAKADVEPTLRLLTEHGERAMLIGGIVPRAPGAAATVVA
jgi:phosphoribosylformylglycinamidine cyclo-ligase